MYEMLIDPARGGRPRDQVTAIINPEGAAWLVQRIRRLAETTTGTFLLYRVGHGVISERGNLTLTLYGRLAHRLHRRGLPRPNQRGTGTVHHFGLARNTAYDRPSWPRADPGGSAPGSAPAPPARRTSRPATTRSAASGHTPVFSSRIRAGKVVTSRLGAQHVIFIVLTALTSVPYATASSSSDAVVPGIVLAVILGVVLTLFLIIVAQFFMTLVELVRPRRLGIGPEGVSIVWGTRRAASTWEEIAALEVAKTGRSRSRSTLMVWRKPAPWGRPARRAPAWAIPLDDRHGRIVRPDGFGSAISTNSGMAVNWKTCWRGGAPDSDALTLIMALPVNLDAKYVRATLMWARRRRPNHCTSHKETPMLIIMIIIVAVVALVLLGTLVALLARGR